MGMGKDNVVFVGFDSDFGQGMKERLLDGEREMRLRCGNVFEDIGRIEVWENILR